MQFGKINLVTLDHLISCFKSCTYFEPFFRDLNNSHIRYQYPSKHSDDA